MKVAIQGSLLFLSLVLATCGIVHLTRAIVHQQILAEAPSPAIAQYDGYDK